MAGETVITVVGNLTADAELRYTPSGAAVANFTVASTPRTFDRQAGEWRDGEAMFLPCNIWNQYAENVAETLTRGTRVIAQGRLVQRTFETKAGEKRTVTELRVDEIGPTLRFATATVNKVRRDGAASTPTPDPWASTPVPVGVGSGGFSEEPPY
jgi:single-strand DNA-binding protein